MTLSADGGSRIIAGVSRQVFISHSSHDQALAQTLCAALESRGMACWIAPRDIALGTTYGPEIDQAIEVCRIFLLVLTDTAAASLEVEREVNLATQYRRRIVLLVVGKAGQGRPVRPHIRLAFGKP